jgi:hypothetical protein
VEDADGFGEVAGPVGQWRSFGGGVIGTTPAAVVDLAPKANDVARIDHDGGASGCDHGFGRASRPETSLGFGDADALSASTWIGAEMVLKSLRGAIALAGCASLFVFGLSSPASATDLGPVGSSRIVRIDPATYQAGSALGAEVLVPSGVRDRVMAQTWNNTSGQKWKMWIVAYVYEHPVVTFQNLRYSNICLDKSMDTSTATTVYLYTCTGGVNQQWLLSDRGSVQYSLGKFALNNESNHLCLTSSGGFATTSPNCYDGYHDYALYDV